MLIALLSQSFLALGSSLTTQTAGELEHWFMHGMEASHHHHDDSSLHLEDEGSPVHHVHADTSPVGLLGDLSSNLTHVRSVSPPEFNLLRWLSPTLEGPLRPPMLNA
jgi:hypothetical protein